MKISVIIGVAMSAVLVAFFNSSEVEATPIGGKYPGSGNVTVYYSYPAPHRYSGNVWQGAANWRNATKAKVQQWPGAPHTVRVDVADVNTGDTWWGGINYNPCATCTYTRNLIRLNQGPMDQLSDFMRTKVATHEFGHAIGLDHPPVWYLPASVMKQGHRSYNTPQTYDINDVNGIY